MYIHNDSVTVCEGRRLKAMLGGGRSGGGGGFTRAAESSVCACCWTINSSGELRVQGYKIDRKSPPGMAFVTRAVLHRSHKASL